MLMYAISRVKRRSFHRKSELQMFLLISGGHIGGLKRYTNIRWPKSSNINQFPKTQISFPKHRTVSQNTNQFPKVQNSFPKHYPVSRGYIFTV